MAARVAVAFAFLLGAAFLVWKRHQPPPVQPEIVPFGMVRYGNPDTHTRLQTAEEAFLKNPDDANTIRELAYIYAVLILNRDRHYEEHARAQLDASGNVWLLGNAAHSFQHLYSQTAQYGRPDPRAADLAEKYFLRAKALDPSLDRAKILPQIDLAEIRREREETERRSLEFQERFAQAEREIVRLPIDEFPELPPTVAGTLRTRGCTVPQAYGFPKHNVIRGEFFRKGEEGSAALCSVGGSSTILVFRNDADTQPHELHKAEDIGYLQVEGGDTIGYSRAITAVDGSYIVRHYEAYDGPKPPPIDHYGIDDAFVGKASAILYFHEGRWLLLQGAD